MLLTKAISFLHISHNKIRCLVKSITTLGKCMFVFAVDASWHCRNMMSSVCVCVCVCVILPCRPSLVMASAQRSDNFIESVLAHLQHSDRREERGGEWEAERCSASDVF